MKYIQTVSLSGGVETDITTTLTTEPYKVSLFDSSGNYLNTMPGFTIRCVLSGGVYHIIVYSIDPLVGVKLKIIY